MGSLGCRLRVSPASSKQVRPQRLPIQTDWAAEIPDSLLIQLARDEEHLRRLRELGPKSYMCIPLLSRFPSPIGFIPSAAMRCSTSFGTTPRPSCGTKRPLCSRELAHVKVKVIGHGNFQHPQMDCRILMTSESHIANFAPLSSPRAAPPGAICCKESIRIFHEDVFDEGRRLG
jgi:hypothetical protein